VYTHIPIVRPSVKVLRYLVRISLLEPIAVYVSHTIFQLLLIHTINEKGVVNGFSKLIAAGFRIYIEAESDNGVSTNGVLATGTIQLLPR